MSLGVNEVIIPGVGLVEKTNILYGAVPRLADDVKEMSRWTERILHEASPEQKYQILVDGPVLELCCGSAAHLRRVAKLHTAFPQPTTDSHATWEAWGVDVDTEPAEQTIARETSLASDVRFKLVKMDIFDFFAQSAHLGQHDVYSLVMFMAADEIIGPTTFFRKDQAAEKRAEALFVSVTKLLKPGGLFVFSNMQDAFRDSMMASGLRPTSIYHDLVWTK